MKLPKEVNKKQVWGWLKPLIWVILLGEGLFYAIINPAQVYVYYAQVVAVLVALLVIYKVTNTHKEHPDMWDWITQVLGVLLLITYTISGIWGGAIGGYAVIQYYIATSPDITKTPFSGEFVDAHFMDISFSHPVEYIFDEESTRGSQSLGLYKENYELYINGSFGIKRKAEGWLTPLSVEYFPNSLIENFSSVCDMYAYVQQEMGGFYSCSNDKLSGTGMIYKDIPGGPYALNNYFVDCGVNGKEHYMVEYVYPWYLNDYGYMNEVVAKTGSSMKCDFEFVNTSTLYKPIYLQPLPPPLQPVVAPE